MRKSCTRHELEKEGKMRLQDRRILKRFSSCLRSGPSGVRGPPRPFG